MGLFKSDNKMFTDEDFRFACRELDTPDTSDWEFFVESHNIKIYRQYNQVKHIVMDNCQYLEYEIELDHETQGKR